jgi:hypothetical protein
MPVIGITLKGINAKKFEEIDGQIKVNSNMNIKDVKEQDLPFLKAKGLAVDFEFKTRYVDRDEKDRAEIGIEGTVIVMEDDMDKIVKDWKKDKKLPEDMKFQVIQIVSDKCSKKAIAISDDLQLPPPPLLITQQNPQQQGKPQKQNK